MANRRIDDELDDVEQVFAADLGDGSPSPLPVWATRLATWGGAVLVAVLLFTLVF